MIYLDTSAFLKLYFIEDGSSDVQSLIASQNRPIPVWDLLEAELTNAFMLKAFWGDITKKQADTQIENFQKRLLRGLYHTPYLDRSMLMAEFTKLRAQTPKIGCRTMDIMHVACAKTIGASLFITFDQRQRQLAKKSGIQIWNPVPYNSELQSITRQL